VRATPPPAGQLAAADQPDIGDGVMRGAEGAGGDDGGTPPGEAGDAMDTGGLQRFRQARRHQEGGEAPRQPRRARPRKLEQQDIMDTMPASHFVSPSLPHLRMIIIDEPLRRWLSCRATLTRVLPAAPWPLASQRYQTPR
jgi:hypothetical protein